LIVDDDPGMLRATERVLAAHYDIASYRSPREALARAAEFAPDIALLDVRMPELSGFELREALQEVCRDVDVIFMTGSLNEIDATLVRHSRQGVLLHSKAFRSRSAPDARRTVRRTPASVG
jgi:FixJ family two-component response regulator